MKNVGILSKIWGGKDFSGVKRVFLGDIVSVTEESSGKIPVHHAKGRCEEPFQLKLDK